MSMALKKWKKNKFFLFWIMLAFIRPVCLSAENPVAGMHYWVQIDEPAENLAFIEKAIIDLPDEIDKSELRICMTDNRYALVHKASREADTAALIKEKLDHHLKNKMVTRIAQYDQSRCFYTAYLLNKENRTKEKTLADASPKSIESKTPAVHIRPDLNRFKINPKEITDSAMPLPNSTAQVLPAIATQVYLSNLDINRITCMGDRPVKDVIYSTEKGITTKINGNNAFVKLQLHQDFPSASPRVIEDPVELYVICGSENDIYTVIGIPRKIPAQWVQLVSKTHDIKKNLSLFEGRDFEKKIVTLIKEAWTENYPDSYTIRSVQRPLAIRDWKWLNVELRRIINIDGEGFTIKEYRLQLNPAAGTNEKKVLEKQFLIPEISENPLAIALDDTAVRKDVPTRLFVVEKSSGESRIGISRNNSR